MRGLFGFCVASAVLAGVAPSGAQASEDIVPRSVAVRVNDLDLASAQGVATLDARIDVAIHKVCTNEDRDLHARELSSRCLRETRLRVAKLREVAIARAVARKDGAALAEVGTAAPLR